jgi:hypothetical protein
MMTTIILTVSLIASMVINIVFVWYTRNLLNYLEMTNEEAGRDLFYGDATLESLLRHTSNLADEIQEYIKANQEIINLEETEIENA